MDKTAIKNFAIWARNKLIADISYKAGLLGITDNEIKTALPQSTKDAQFYDIGSVEPYRITGATIAQRKALVDKIRVKAEQSDYGTAYKAVIEEVAYTWFNRLIAVRFMEVNDYLPSRIRVLSSATGKTEPDIVTTPFETGLEFSEAEQELVIACKTDNKLDELFRMLFIKQCNALNAILPELFEQTGNYTDLLLNVSFIDKDGVVWHLVHDIAEEDFTEAVEIIGWMYQYYNTELKDETFALLKKNVKITKERIPAATQLFTPDWIVRYMVENSLGRLWLEGHPNDALKANWKYYLDEAEQTPEVQSHLEQIRVERRGLSPEDITFIDPCMGSGHILVYAFDVFMQIYESVGYSRRDAARLILEKNLHGLDIDKRACQLAYFALMMKARQYNRRIFTENAKPQLYHPQGWSDGEEYGSLIKVDELEEMPIQKDAYSILDPLLDTPYEIQLNTWNFRRLLHQKYDVVVTNPPYMGNSGMSDRLSKFVKDNFPDSKNDLFAAFIEQCRFVVKPQGYFAMITQHAWMFLSSYEKLRTKLQSSDTVNMAHLGARAFAEIGGEVVQSTAFVMRDGYMSGYKGVYVRLVDIDDAEGKEQAFWSGNHRYTATAGNFAKIPGSPVAYWVSEAMIKSFEDAKTLKNIAEPRQGLATADNNRFLRIWFEVPFTRIGFNFPSIDEAQASKKKWFPYNKGGDFRKWYGNNDYIVNWENDGHEIRSFDDGTGYIRSRAQNTQFYFLQSITWSFVSSSYFGVRYSPVGAIFDVGGSSVFPPDNLKYYLTGFLCSILSSEYMQIQNPTLNFQVGNVATLPIIIDETKKTMINELVITNISLSSADWDSFETSWDFKRHPLIGDKTIAAAFAAWEKECNERFDTLKTNEEELNRIFIDIYGLQDELTPEVEDKDVTVRRADLGREIRSFVSYAVGCMFGRYSLDVEGLAYAGGEWDAGKYSSFIPDRDNILPLTDEEYLTDDIVTRFVEFVRVVYGTQTLEENLRFIAAALGSKGNTAREVIRNYFLRDFYKDHVKIYKKRPIYWLFNSGKADGFKALIYLHRYDQDTVGKLRVDYLHRLQRVYESEIARMRETIEKSADAREQSAAQKRLEKLIKQLKETKDYDEKIAHLALARIALDLDDGVKVNYEKLQTGTDGKKYEVLGKI